MLNEARRLVTTSPGTGQVVTTPGASCSVGSAHVLLSIIGDFLIDLMPPNLICGEIRHLTTMLSLLAFNNLSAYQSSRFT